MNIPSIPAPPTYDRQLQGVYGEFGSGGGARAFFLQTAMTPRQLRRVKLVAEIPGSERWPVRALFQREVDRKRVETGLMPYLCDQMHVRFFNPITLTLLPQDRDQPTIRPTMPDITEDEEVIGAETWTVLEREGFHRLRWVKNQPQYAIFEWSSERNHLVAIDGQHRLFGIHSIWKGSADMPAPDDFLQWRIPVVLASFCAAESDRSSPTVLDTVRRIFVSINTEARPVNETRRILLSEESINAVCAQEIVEAAHANDRRPIADRDDTRTPLLVFDWRGEEQGGKEVQSPTALFSVKEVHDWFKTYFLGLDFTRRQEKIMRVTPNSPLHEAFRQERLSPEHTRFVREWAMDDILEGLNYLLSSFTPYARYIRALRQAESATLDRKRPDLERHAFDRLRFGTSRASSVSKDDVDDALNLLHVQIQEARHKSLDRLFRLGIGHRGVAFAFGLLRERLHGPPDWLSYSEHFVTALNAAESDGWLGLDGGADHRDQLLHVAVDPANQVIHHKLNTAKRAIGTHTALLVAAYGAQWPKAWKFDWHSFVKERLEIWRSTVHKGYLKQYRSALVGRFQGSEIELVREAQRMAERGARGRATTFQRQLEALAKCR